MVVTFLGIVMRGTREEIVFGGGAQAEQHGCIDMALAGLDELHRARCGGPDFGRYPRDHLGIHEVGLVQYDQVGAEELVLIDFLKRIIVVDRGVAGALCGDHFRAVGEAAGRDRRAHRRRRSRHRRSAWRELAASRRP